MVQIIMLLKKVRSLMKTESRKFKKKKKGKELYLELEGERGENDGTLLLKDFSDVVAGGSSHG